LVVHASASTQSASVAHAGPRVVEVVDDVEVEVVGAIVVVVVRGCGAVDVVVGGAVPESTISLESGLSAVGVTVVTAKP